jgi:hypothetical protein
MKNEETIKLVAAVGFITLVVAPAVIGATVGIIGSVANIVHNHKIRKGLKNGSIVEIDGQYYEYKKDVDEA